MMAKVFLASMTLILILASGCQSGLPTASCSDYFPEQMNNLPFEALNSSNMADWITKTFNLGRSDIEAVEPGTNLAWKANGVFYRAIFDDSKQLQRIAMGWDHGNKPTLRLVLKCFGTPSSFSAISLPSMSKGMTVEFNLLYAFKGVLFGASLDNVSVVPDTAGLDLFIVKPGSDSDVISSVYANDTTGVFKKSLRPWPSRIEDLVVVKGTP